jgi:hypothetical protein
MSLTDYERELIRNVAEFGWQCLSVGAGDDEPGFSYTIGLWETFGAPELIVFGLDSGLMYEMLACMVDALRRGARVDEGARWPLLRNHDCISRRVHPSQINRDHFNSALWYRRHRGEAPPLEAYQLFWPGVEDGLFPWEAGCSARVRELQPRLDLPAEHGLA